MRICIAYVCVSKGIISADYASRFVATFVAYPPGEDADVFILCNGGAIKNELALIFAPLKAKLFIRNNDEGWDISAYIDAARGPCGEYDMMVCLGESNYFHRSGWLRRLCEAWNKYGPGMYGPYATNVIRTHLQTTAFVCSPKMLLQYPKPVNNRGDRYEFEHGERAFWRIMARNHVPVRLVTWDGEWEPRQFRFPKNIVWRGDQSNCLMWCNHTEKWQNSSSASRDRWSYFADRPFK